MLSGFFFAFAVVKYGVTKWREKFINTPDSDVRIGKWWDWAMRLVLVEAVVLMVWFLVQAGGDDFWSAETWTLFSSYNVGSVLIQWALALAASSRSTAGWCAGSRPRGKAGQARIQRRRVASCRRSARSSAARIVRGRVRPPGGPKLARGGGDGSAEGRRRACPQPRADPWPSTTPTPGSPVRAAAPGPGVPGRRFAAIAREAEERGVDSGNPAAFVMLGAVQGALAELQEDDAGPESAHDHAGILFLAYHFWRCDGGGRARRAGDGARAAGGGD